ncbi:MAG: DUF2442 domain-containing protein [Pseudomonadota bacterium]
MSTLDDALVIPTVQSVGFTPDAIRVALNDGRELSVPLAWYPRLLNGTPRERENVEIIGQGEGLHWPDLDDDISVEALIRGLPSRESPASLERWLNGRTPTSD